MDDALEALVTTELGALDFDLVELRRRGSRSRPVLEVRIERRDGAALAVDDCARVSRAIEARLDESRLAGERYVLEVSSPGVERPLRNAAEWRRFVGRSAVVTATPLPGGKAEVVILAVEGEAGAEVVQVRDERGVEHRLPLSTITQARLAFHWNR
ncbi:MAG: ribosome maturation factor RimP [Gemmatirosa sp.]|nr:ribosome maturation factor RimP [Gemmatirosa sp.]